ncbi:cytochrome c oxidase assembly protein [Consotaella salsifontis]|uniref:Cytochrome c oxidase assembly protein CtaG n=1 Tax=Consotaella salsifontis TaxID=1365950 RepID=A0A1T4MXA8_9HYPH|nr:cytochrome c oxidase assembly protein [Consotaella salsifontis]SJZ71486.1 cytochrome c oxidase assembly protein subunit 11 [Consotaella salsifontis]
MTNDKPVSTVAERQAKARRRGMTIAIVSAAFSLGMLGAAFASVPLYRVFCQVTGYGGTTQRAEGAPVAVSDKQVTVRFDSNSSPGVPWTFQPLQRSVRVKLGEARQIAYRVKNHSDHRVTAQATFNVTPESAGAYFNKIACFCFTEQTLEPGEERDMPVVFFIDPAIADTEEMASLPPITLSYTFFPIEEEARPVAEAPAGGKEGGKGQL